MLNMEPLADITATLLFDFLEVREVLHALRRTGTSVTKETLGALPVCRCGPRMTVAAAAEGYLNRGLYSNYV